MKGFVFITEVGMKTKKAFNYWIDLRPIFNSKAKQSKKRSRNSIK